MRNQKSNVRVIKHKFHKCEQVCRAYSDVQFAYAKKLDEDESIVSFECNVPLTGLDMEGAFTTDFLIVKSDGDYAVRECVAQDKLLKPRNITLLDASHIYWHKRGIVDWGVVVNE